jgi:hypothetical protein
MITKPQRSTAPGKSRYTSIQKIGIENPLEKFSENKVVWRSYSGILNTLCVEGDFFLVAHCITSVFNSTLFALPQNPHLPVEHSRMHAPAIRLFFKPIGLKRFMGL